jgi:Zn-dependent protease
VEEKKGKLLRWSAIIAAKGAKLVKVVKLLKFGKVFLTFSSMMLSVFVYSFMLGPWFALGFVVMLFIHEMGHIVALRMRGHNTQGPVFIPMLGAVIFAPKFKDAEEEAFVGFAGPFTGGVAAFGAFIVWILTNRTSDILLLVSYTATFINLFNLIPLRPLDGGRITQIAGKWFQYVGLVALLGFSLFIKQPSILLIWILILGDVRMEPKLKFGCRSAFWIGMVTLMSLGYSDQAFWVNILDGVLGAQRSQ